MFTSKTIEIEAKHISSLCWAGDRLVDLLDIGVSYDIEGNVHEPNVGTNYAYRFDSVTSFDRYAVLYTKFGTKGLLLDLIEHKIVRELNRSFYHAMDYHYPIHLFRLPESAGEGLAGEIAIVHCPNDYCTLEIELAKDGRRLTERKEEGSDVFHTRLSSSSDGRFIAENGWVWHPWNIVQAFDVEKALNDPDHLNERGLGFLENWVFGWEAMGATICGPKHLVVEYWLDNDDEPDEDEDLIEALKADGVELQRPEKGVPEPFEEEEDEVKVRAIPGADITVVDKDGNEVQPPARSLEDEKDNVMMVTYDLETGKAISAILLPYPLGRVMPIDEHHLVSFYDHPRLMNIMTGKVLERWKIDPGPEQRLPSVSKKVSGPPFIAMDSENMRFAIGNYKSLTMVLLSKD